MKTIITMTSLAAFLIAFLMLVIGTCYILVKSIKAVKAILADEIWMKTVGDILVGLSPVGFGFSVYLGYTNKGAALLFGLAWFALFARAAVEARRIAKKLASKH